MEAADRAKSKVGLSVTKSTTKSVGNFNQSTSFREMRMRKKSYGFGTGVSGIKTSDRRSSQLGIEFKRPQLQFLNTYQLDPRVRFHAASVTNAANDALNTYFDGHKYNQQDSPILAVRIAGTIMRSVKAMNFNRYRIIAVVTLGQKRSQSYNNAVSFLWDHERDGIVNLQREVTTAFIQVTIFGIYLD